MVVLRNILAVLAISVCLAAACQKEEEVVVGGMVRDNWVESGPIYAVLDQPVIKQPGDRYSTWPGDTCSGHLDTALHTVNHFMLDGEEQPIEMVSESRTVDLYIVPEGEEDSYVSYDVVVEGIQDTIRCTGGWAGTFKSYKVGGLDITIYCKQHIPTRVSLEWHMEEVDFAYSEDAAYESLNVSYHW